MFAKPRFSTSRGGSYAIVGVLSIGLVGCSVTGVPGDPVSAPDTDKTACLTASSWTLDLHRYTEDVATADAIAGAPVRDVAATGTLSIKFTRDFLFAAAAKSFLTERTYASDGDTVVARWTRDDEVSGEWDWFNNETLVVSRVVYLTESVTNEALINGETTVNFFPEPPRFYLSDGGPWRVTCTADRLILDSDGVIPWHFLPD